MSNKMSVRFKVQSPPPPSASSDDELDDSAVIQASAKILGDGGTDQEPSSQSESLLDDTDKEAPKNSTSTTTTTKSKRNIGLGLGGKKQLSFKQRTRRRLTARSASFDMDGKGYLTKEESAARALADESGNVPPSAVVMLMNRLKATDKKVVKLKFISFSTLLLLIGVGAALTVIVTLAGKNTMGVIEENAVTSVEKDPRGVTHLSDKKTGDVLTVRGDGDTFVADQRSLEGESFQCVPITQVAAMVNDVAHATPASLVFKNEEGIESNVLSLAGDFEDEGDALTFANKKIKVALNSDACNQARRLIASDGGEVDEKKTSVIQTGQQGRGNKRSLRNPMSVTSQAQASRLSLGATPSGTRPRLKNIKDEKLSSLSGNDRRVTSINPDTSSLTEAEITEKHRKQYVAARLRLDSTTGAADGRYLETFDEALADVPIYLTSDSSGDFTKDLPIGRFFIKSRLKDEYIYVQWGCNNGGIVSVGNLYEDDMEKNRFTWEIVKNPSINGYRIESVHCRDHRSEIMVLGPKNLKCEEDQPISLTDWTSNKDRRQKWVDNSGVDSLREFNVHGTCNQEITLSGNGLITKKSSKVSVDGGGNLENQQWILYDENFALAGCQKEADKCGGGSGTCCYGLECHRNACYRRGVRLEDDDYGAFDVPRKDLPTGVFLINAFSSLFYMHLPLDLGDVCKNGVGVQVGGVSSQHIFESDESSLSKYRWRIITDGSKGDYLIASVFCEEKFGKNFVISVAQFQSGKPIILTEWTGGDAIPRQKWVNGHTNDSVRVFRPKSNNDFSIAVETSDNSLVLDNFSKGDSTQQWVLLDEDGQLGGCKKHLEECNDDGQCCFGMQCATQGSSHLGKSLCLHVPRQLGEPCDADSKCADPYHCGGYGGDGEKVCRELDEGEEGDKCGNVFGCKEGLFCIRKRCLNEIGYEQDPTTGEWEAYSHYYNHQGSRDGWGYVWDVQNMWHCATKDGPKDMDYAATKGICDFDDPCICTATLPGSDYYSTYRSLVRDINSKQEELETVVRNLDAVNKFNHDMELNQDSIAWSYSSYASEFLGQQVDVCLDIGGFSQDCYNHTLEGIEKQEWEGNCTAAKAEYESKLNANGEYCGNATQADVMADEFSSEIMSLEEELITLRSERDELIDAVNSEIHTFGPNEATVLDWYVMEQFKEPWKFRESFLERHKCLIITAVLFVIKQIFNFIGKAIMKTFESAVAAAAGPAGALVTYAAALKQVFCAGILSGHPGQAWVMSWLAYGVSQSFRNTYLKFRDKNYCFTTEVDELFVEYEAIMSCEENACSSGCKCDEDTKICKKDPEKKVFNTLADIFYGMAISAEFANDVANAILNAFCDNWGSFVISLIQPFITCNINGCWESDPTCTCPYRFACCQGSGECRPRKLEQEFIELMEAQEVVAPQSPRMIAPPHPLH